MIRFIVERFLEDAFGSRRKFGVFVLLLVVLAAFVDARIGQGFCSLPKPPSNGTASGGHGVQNEIFFLGGVLLL